MIVETLKAAAKKMMIDFEEVTAKINHMGERGTSREELLLKYLREYFPTKYELSRGAIIDATGIQSKQQDLIVYDSFSSPVLLNMESTKMIPIESVYMTIEVKSTLDKKELKKCINNIKSVRELPRFPLTDSISPTAGFVFAFTSSTSLETLTGNLIEFNKDIDVTEQISMICVLDKGLIVNINKKGLNDIEIIPSKTTTPAIINNAIENNLLTFYLFLMQYLNIVSVSPPNLFKYAEQVGLANLKYQIPREYIPSGTYVEFGENKIEVDNMLALTDSLDSFNTIQQGKATFEQFMKYYSENLSRINQLSSSMNGNSRINFYGISYESYILQNVFDLYLKTNKGLELTITEKKFYEENIKQIWEHYSRSL